MSIFSSLNRQQKEAVGLLQIGTFLEYFDLMLYVHMAIVLNEVFFPKTDPHTAALLTAFAFCSTYVLRPFGAIIFGYIGDTIGRKTTVIITTMMMSLSCVIMANLPTYAEIGITAAWIVTICRMVQGMSSMGEVIGCKVYITEITKSPVRYPAVAFIGAASSLGAVIALGVACLTTRVGFNWRIAFWIGATIAVIGSVARVRLRETPEFVDMKRKLQRDLDDNQLKNMELKTSTIKQYIKACKREKISKVTLTAYSLIECGWPITFYFGYMYFNTMLKSDYGYLSEDIVMHNFFLSIITLLMVIFWAKLSYTVDSLKILEVRGIIFGAIILVLPFLLIYTSHQYQIFALQSLLLSLPLSSSPADPILIKIIPIFKRFTVSSFLYAMARALVYLVTSFGLVYLTEAFGHFGLWVIVLPLCLGFLWSVRYFKQLESKKKVNKVINVHFLQKVA